MSKFFDRYKTDKKLEEEGVWVDLGEGIHVLVARISSRRAREVRRRIMRPYESMRELPPELEERINIEVMAEAVLVGWRGITDEQNNPIPYSKETAIRLLTEAQDFREDVAGASLRRELYRQKAIEGNSSY